MQLGDVTLSVETFLHTIEIVSIVVGGLSVAYRIGKTHSTIAAAIKNQNQATQRQGGENFDLKNEIQKGKEVVTALAVQEKRSHMDRKGVDEIGHGHAL